MWGEREPQLLSHHNPRAYSTCLDLDVELLGEGLGGGGLRALDGAALKAVPDEARHDADLAGDAEEDGVVVLLGEAVVLEATRHQSGHRRWGRGWRSCRAR